MNWTTWVPLLASALAAGVAIGTAIFTLRAARKQRDMTRQLKIAEFRQQWINDLRDTMVKFSTERVSEHQLPDPHSEDARRIIANISRIKLLMNPKDQHYNALGEAMEKYAFVTNQDEEKLAVKQFMVTCQKILKNEWERLKSDLGQIEK